MQPQSSMYKNYMKMKNIMKCVEKIKKNWRTRILIFFENL